MNKSSQFRLLNHHLKKCGFSLMEIMIIMLVVAVVAAATTPMITSRLGLGTVANTDLLWQKEDGSHRIFFKNGENRKAIVGSYKYKVDDINNAPSNPSLVLVSKQKDELGPIIFNNSSASKLTAYFYINPQESSSSVGLYHYDVDPNNNDVNKEHPLANKTVAIGKNLKLPQVYKGGKLDDSKLESCGYNVTVGYQVENIKGDSVVIGANATSQSARTVVIGSGEGNKESKNLQTRVLGVDNAIAIGYNAKVTAGKLESIGDEKGPVVIGANSYVGSSSSSGDKSVAINGRVNGANSVAIAGNVDGNSWDSIAILGDIEGSNSIAIGNGVTVRANNSIAIGNGATIKEDANNSIAIGYNVKIDEPDRVVIGNDDSVSANIIGLDIKNESGVYKINNINVLEVYHLWINDVENQEGIPIDNYIESVLTDNKYTSSSESDSDIRLKNVGERYTAGLDEIKKLELFNYTYKNDEKQTPHVGVIAQDLQKIFPDAVTKGSDGYLRIRMEDMFYALINAVKELDNKIDELANKVKDFAVELANLKSTYIEQQKILEQRQIALAERSKQLDELSAKVDALKNEKHIKEPKVEKVKSEPKEKIKKDKKVKEKKVINVDEAIN